jgi:archaeosortase B (VPXXXP-CTERM-specific)
LAKAERRKQSKDRRVADKKRKNTPAIETRTDIVRTIEEKVSENKEALRYVSLFLAFCFVFYLVYYSLTLRGSLSLLKNLTASILGALFSLGGANVAIHEATVSINGFGLEIIDECTAVYSSIVYSACILAYPTTRKNKGLGIAFGVPALYGINMLRLSILALVGIYHPNMFEFVHVYLWQASFIIFVVVLFLLWLRLVVK